MSQPTGRPEAAAFAPLTMFVQSCALSSIQAPAAFFLTIRPTLGGVGNPATIGGSKTVPLFGGGLAPAYGPVGSLTTLGGKPMFIRAPPPSTVEWLPDSKMAA